MVSLEFATSNNLKFLAATEVCHEHDIKLKQAALELLEIQSDNGETIARHKADAAFKALQTPLVVSDDSWIIPGFKRLSRPLYEIPQRVVYAGRFLTPDD